MRVLLEGNITEDVNLVRGHKVSCVVHTKHGNCELILSPEINKYIQDVVKRQLNLKDIMNKKIEIVIEV